MLQSWLLTKRPFWACRSPRLQETPTPKTTPFQPKLGNSFQPKLGNQNVGGGGGVKRTHTESASELLCNVCGGRQHVAEECAYKDDTTSFFFNHKDIDYASSIAWTKVQQKYPGILAITKIPRAPNARQVKQYNAENATKGGSSKTPSQGNKSLAHLNMIAHSCDNCDVCKVQSLTPQSMQNNDECVNTLTIANTHSPYLN